MRIVALSAAVFLTLVAATDTPRHRAAIQPAVNYTTLDIRRSFVITDVALLEGFTFQRVLDQLVARSGVTNVTTAQLYRQWFDTQNPKPGLADAATPHCDDFTTNGSPSFNGFARRCPTPEGALAASSFTSGEYFSLAVVNRFDQAPADGSNCGQFRLIFARRTPDGQRLHIIFEPVLRNPNPSAGLAGCRPVAEFWAGLTKIDSPSERRAKLESFYFDGLTGFAPVIDPAHFAPSSGGGIRTMQMSGDPFVRSYQFRLTKGCSAECTLRMTPDVLENNPAFQLFDSTVGLAGTQAFQDTFVEQVPNLAVNDVDEYFMQIPPEFLVAEEGAALTKLQDLPQFAIFRSSGFVSRIQQKLSSIGSTLTPTDIVLRSQTLGCSGCHGDRGPVGGGVVFPQSADSLQHVADNLTEPGELGQPRFLISPAMRDVFIPHRMKILIDFLNTGKAPVKSE